MQDMKKAFGSNNMDEDEIAKQISKYEKLMKGLNRDKQYKA
jgi:hypothetical protein